MPADSSDDAALLTDYLRARDATCPLCQYNLRGLTSSRCPECGQELRLRVSLAEPYLKAWVATAVALLPMAGMGVFWAALVPVLGFPKGREAHAVVPILVQMTSIPFAIAAVVGQRRFRRWERQTQRIVSSAAAVLSVASFAALVHGFTR